MTLIPNSQSFGPYASGLITTQLKDAFKQNMDSVLVGLGRDITLHLPPSKMPCTAPDCRFNSTYKKFVGSNGALCESCRGQGFIYEPRQTVYRANIRWTEVPLAGSRWEELSVAGRMYLNVVRTKTVAASFDHIKECQSATIDGQNMELFEEPRLTGFSDILYTISIWKRVNT